MCGKFVFNCDKLLTFIVDCQPSLSHNYSMNADAWPGILLWNFYCKNCVVSQLSLLHNKLASILMLAQQHSSSRWQLLYKTAKVKHSRLKQAI